MSGTSKELVPRFFDHTALTYDKIVNRTTFGKDKYWKREILKKIPQCTSILELACGTGILTEKISKNFPNAKIVGVDITQSYLDIAKKKLASNQNISFVKQDAEKLNLNQIAQKIESAEFNPERFPGLVMKSENPSVSIILFSNGKMVITGLKKTSAAEQVVEEAINKIKELGINLTNPKISIESTK